MSRAISLRSAEPSDRQYIESLLEDSGLPAADISAALPHLYICATGGERIGTGGFEQYGEVALLRSVAVDDAVRGEGYGTAICGKLLDRARAAGVDEVYLLTTTAAEFFARIGFERTERGSAPEAIRETTQFSHLCPDSAVCMRRRLEAETA